ncbi:MAG: MarR family transcriptional regulator [Eubacteriales bacterium]|nr:MarR family transcriptional regulator [Eubacteriales bacterium]
MKKDLFGGKVDCENVEPPFVLVGLLNRFDNRYHAAADAFFKERTWKQMYFLNAVSLFEEAPTIQDIADFMGSSNQNANKLYAKLLQDGYVTSVRDERDKRKQRLFLTDKAKEFLEENHVGHNKNVRDIFEVVSEEEMETVIDVMSRLTDHLEYMIADDQSICV